MLGCLLITSWMCIIMYFSLLCTTQVAPAEAEPEPAKPKVDRSQFLEEMRRKLDRLKGAPP